MSVLLGFFKYLFKYRVKLVDRVLFYISLVCAMFVLVHAGYITDSNTAAITGRITVFLFYGLFALEFFYMLCSVLVFKPGNAVHYSRFVILIYFAVVALARNVHWDPIGFLAGDEWLYLSVLVVFVAQFSKSSLFFDRLYFNPTIFFVFSFLALILLGAVLLMLPRTTISTPLSFVDAFFMATSAVCITGLSVVDLSSQFSFFGQLVILLLIQMGGLGIMTFTGFFGYFFSGGFSFKNQLMFGELLGENKLNEVIRTLLTIIFITLLFEAVGAVLIFFSLDPTHFSGVGKRVFFSVFHAVSGFCNAGFSILQAGNDANIYRFNYAFQLSLTFMFILGTLGFSTIFNLYTYARAKVASWMARVFLQKVHKHKAQYLTFNTRFILLCNVVVIVAATVSFFAMEFDHSLQQDGSIFGKLATSFFMANSARTAGFQSVAVGSLLMPTLIMTVTLMWMGSSPGSTGGGVKVTTVAIALLNIITLAKGKDSIALFKRRIGHESVSKAFAVIFLSFVAILLSFILLNVTSGHSDKMALLFEAISAYTTSGLSLGITPSLDAGSKIVLMVTMFVGRVGTLTLLVAFIKDTRNKGYTYPTEKIMF